MASEYREAQAGLLARIINSLLCRLRPTQARPVQPHPFLDLSPELHREIHTWLTPGDILLLSLTCKDLWARRDLAVNCLKRFRRYTPRSERLETLLLIEKDIPNYILCTVCERFEKIESEWACSPSIPSPIPSPSRLRSCSSMANPVHAHKRAFRIHRRALDLVIRGATLGPDFGLPTSSLNISSSYFVDNGHLLDYHADHTFKITTTTQCRLVEAPSTGKVHLFLRSQKSLELDLAFDLKKNANAARLEVCDHDSRRERSLITDVVDSLARATSTDTQLAWSATHQCEYCPTDMEVTVLKEDKDCVFAALTLTAWRDLGPRGCHTNAIWAAQTQSLFALPSPFARTAEKYVFGKHSLKEAWSRGMETGWSLNKRLEAWSG